MSSLQGNVHGRGRFTGNVSNGRGLDGKSAYEYAVDGGYKGTEEEFAVKLAEENPTRDEFSKLSKEAAYLDETDNESVDGAETDDITAEQIAQIQKNKEDISQLSKEIEDIKENGNTGNIPETLPNPHALTFTGAVTGTYDGSQPLEVEIPSGGGLSAELIATIESDGVSTVMEQSADLSKDGLYAIACVLKPNLETNNASNIVYFRVGASSIYTQAFSFFHDANESNTVSRRGGVIFSIVNKKASVVGVSYYGISSLSNMCEVDSPVYANKIMLTSASNIAIPIGITMKLFRFK